MKTHKCLNKNIYKSGRLQGFINIIIKVNNYAKRLIVPKTRFLIIKHVILVRISRSVCLHCQLSGSVYKKSDERLTSKFISGHLVKLMKMIYLFPARMAEVRNIIFYSVFKDVPWTVKQNAIYTSIHIHTHPYTSIYIHQLHRYSEDGSVMKYDS